MKLREIWPSAPPAVQDDVDEAFRYLTERLMGDGSMSDDFSHGD